MKMNTLGRTGIAISELCLGTMTWGEQNTQADAFEQMDFAVEAGVNENKMNVLIKAEKNVAHREVARVAAAASRVEGIRLHLAVLEAN